MKRNVMYINYNKLKVEFNVDMNKEHCEIYKLDDSIIIERIKNKDKKDPRQIKQIIKMK